MAGKQLPSESTYHGMPEGSPYKLSNVRHEEGKMAGWYFSRKEIEENSPSRKDGIDLKKETYLWKSYCTFLQDLGMRLKVPQVTIATAIVFCHRFFLRQSHAKNDRRTIATVCMFLAGKVEETPRPLKDVILVSYDIINKKDPLAAQRIKQREVFEQQKELILIGERLVLATLGFDLNVLHPYKHLVEAIKKFKVAQNTLAQVAWNFVNDGLRTSLCLQFKPHHVAAGAIFLAAKFLKVKLPSDGEKVWWQELDVTPRQLEEVSNQMLELYEQNRVPQSHGNDAEGSSAAGTSHHAPPRAPSYPEENVTEARSVHVPKAAPSPGTIPASSSTVTARNQSYLEKQNGLHGMHTEAGDHARHEQRSDKLEAGIKDDLVNPESSGNQSYHGHERSMEVPAALATEAPESREKNNGSSEDYIGSSPMLDAIKKIDKDKVKAALEKRRKARADASRKVDPVDEDDLIERELEHGVELAAEDERSKLEKGHGWSKCQNSDRAENGFHRTEKTAGNAEGGPSLDARTPSPVTGSHKRRAISPSNHHRMKDGHIVPPKYRDRDSFSDGRPVERLEHAERDYKRHRQDN